MMDPTGEPEAEGEPSAEGTVTLVDILVPPFGLIFLLLFGMVVLMITACWKRRKIDGSIHRCHANMVDDIAKTSATYNFGDIEISNDHSDPFLTAMDVDAMRSLKRHYNRPLSLLVINFPAVISLALCPCLLLLRMKLSSAFWPEGMPNINDGLACYLAPAGLVYAITFGFTFQSVLEKQLAVTNTISAEVGLLDQILTLTSRMTSLTREDKLKIYKLVKTEIVSIMQQVTGQRDMGVKDYQHEYSAGQIWGVIDILQEDDRKLGDNCDPTLMDKMISNIQELSTCGTQRHMTLRYKVHPLLWIFLEMLGFFTFLGVMLIKTYSAKMDLMICMITVFSISLLCFVVADLDNPFAGYFRVPLNTLWYLVGKAEYSYRQEREKFAEFVKPSSSINGFQ